MSPSLPDQLARLAELEGLLLLGLARDGEPPERLAGTGDPAPVAASATAFLQAQRILLGRLASKGDLEDFVFSFSARLLICRPLRNTPSRYLFLLLDRARSNLALARLLLGQYEQALS